MHKGGPRHEGASVSFHGRGPRFLEVTPRRGIERALEVYTSLRFSASHAEASPALLIKINTVEGNHRNEQEYKFSFLP